MLELAALGSKVMQARSVEFAKKFGVVFEVRSSFNDNPGTIVKEETTKMEDVVIRGVAVDKNQARVTIAGVPDKPGIAAKVFKTIADANINIDVIVQNISEKGFTDISFTVAANEAFPGFVFQYTSQGHARPYDPSARPALFRARRLLFQQLPGRRFDGVPCLHRLVRVDRPFREKPSRGSGGPPPAAPAARSSRSRGRMQARLPIR